MQKGSQYLLTIALLVIILTITFTSPLVSKSLSGKVMFLTTTTATTDQPLIDKLTSWGLTVETVTTADFKLGNPVDSVIAAYKLVFVSEAVGSGDLARFRGATLTGTTTWTTGWLPVPMVNNDNFCSRVSALGFVPASAGYGNIAGNVEIVDETSHPLAAGFAKGQNVAITSGPSDGDPNIQYTYVTPDTSIRVIPIAAIAGDLTKLVVFGVETGTAVFNSLAVNDGSVKTKARYAAVGINATAYPKITDDGWNMMKAAIDWVIAGPVADVEESVTPPTDFALLHNYPNPFNPATRISYAIPNETSIRLEVFDVLGRHVATLVDGMQQPGIHSVDFDAANLASGVYIYSLTSVNRVLTGKMMLMK